MLMVCVPSTASMFKASTPRVKCGPRGRETLILGLSSLFDEFCWWHRRTEHVAADAHRDARGHRSWSDVTITGR
jgi:hypothetical protein